MGVTIHYNCYTDDLDAVLNSIAFVREMVKGEERWLHPAEISERGGEFGIYINNEGETFSWVWNQKKGEWYKEYHAAPQRYKLADFTKTQVFSEEKAMDSLTYHIWIAEVLDTIRRCYLPTLYISDEGDYLLKRPSEDTLAYWKKLVMEGRPDYLKRYVELRPKDPSTLAGAHGENLALIKSLGEALTKTGWTVVTPVGEGEQLLTKETMMNILSSFRNYIQEKGHKVVALINSGRVCRPEEPWPPEDLARKAGIIVSHVPVPEWMAKGAGQTKLFGNPGSDFFTAKYDDWGGYWTVIFNPKGLHSGRYTEVEAKTKAREYNGMFSNPQAKSNRFVGKKMRGYHADGSLMWEATILSVASSHPKLKEGTRIALLSTGKQVAGRDEDFEGWTKEKGNPSRTMDSNIERLKSEGFTKVKRTQEMPYSSYEAWKGGHRFRGLNAEQIIKKYEWTMEKLGGGNLGRQRTVCRQCGQVLDLSDETERLTGLCDVCFQGSMEGKPGKPREGKCNLCGADEYWNEKYHMWACTNKNCYWYRPKGNPGNPGNLQSIIQKENEYFKTYGRPTERDFSINDIQREKIKAFYGQHPQAYVGKINRTERVGSPLEKYNGQMVYNFGYDFIIPQHDAELERLLLEREQAPYTGTKEDAERLDKIYVRVKTIGGLYLYWA